MQTRTDCRVGLAAVVLAAALSASGEGAKDSRSWEERLLEADRKGEAGEYGAFVSQMEGLSREAEEFAPGDRRKALALQALGAAYFEAGRPLDASRSLERASKLMTLDQGRDVRREAVTLNLLAAAYMEAAQYAKAEKAVRRVREILTGNEKEASAELARADLLTGKILMERGRFREAEETVRSALARVDGAESQSEKERMFLWNLLGILNMEQKHWSRAEEAYMRAAELSRKLLGAQHVNTAKAEVNLAGVLHRLRRFEESEALARQALGVLEAQLGPGHPAVGAALTERAAALKGMGRSGESKMLRIRGQEILERFEAANRVTDTVDVQVLAVQGKQ